MSTLRRIPLWIRLSIAVPASLLLATLFLFRWVEWTETRRWNQMRATCEELARERSSLRNIRPFLRGSGVLGNAWDDYEAALRYLKTGWKKSLAKEFLEDSPKADPSEVRQWVAALAPALARLREGASKGLIKRNIDWRHSRSVCREAERLVLLARCQARFLREAGETRQAAELLLDAAQFGEDMGANGGFVDAAAGIFVLGTSLDELRLVLLSETTGSPLLSHSARELEKLDLGFPSEANAYLASAMEMGFDFLSAGSAKEYLTQLEWKDKELPTWSFGFSERIMMVDAFQTCWSLMRTYQEAAYRPWPQARKLMGEADRQYSRSLNPLVQIAAEIRKNLDTGHPQDVFRERQAQLRLLRLAIHYRTTGEILVLDDPFGNRLLSSKTEKGVRLWSVGPDGVDDGGQGNWQPAKGKDIVLEIQR